MADTYTGASALSSDQAAYDKFAYFALRPQLHFDMFASVKPSAGTDPGSSVKFTLYDDLAVASTALSESADVDAQAMADSQVTLTPAEYGNAVITTAKIRGTSFFNVDRDAANIVGFNAGVSQDTLARDVLKAGTNVRYSSDGTTAPTARNEVEADDIFKSDDVRKVKADLDAANVPDFGGYYTAAIHPHVNYDLRRETGAGAWRTPREYVDPGQIYNGETGEFEGFRFIVTSRAPIFADAGSSTTLTDVYASLFFGFQALAKTYSVAESAPLAQVVIGPVTDKLRRFHPLGWKWFGQYGVFRQAALRRVESAATLGTNA